MNSRISLLRLKGTKYVTLGLFTLIFGLILPACFSTSPQTTQAEQSSTPESVQIANPTPTTTPTPTPTSTLLPVPTPTPIPTPLPAANTIPTPVIASAPSPSPTATPTPVRSVEPSPTLREAAIPNLTFFTPKDWGEAVIAANERGLRERTELLVGTETYISMAIDDNGEFGADDDVFNVDLYFDGKLVERWRNLVIPPNFGLMITDWDALQSRVNISPGEHVLKFVIDSTNLVMESDESDNVIEEIFVWNPPDEIILTETPVRSRLPDFSPFVPKGWNSPFIVTSYEGDVVDGPLSVDVTTYIKFSFENSGLTSTSKDIWAYLYFDGVLVDSIFWKGLLAGQFIKSNEWDGLSEVVNLAPGVHTLKIEFDATNLVDELDENNNVFEKELTWGVGPVSPKASIIDPTKTPVPSPPTLPNLVPGWKFGQDGPIIVSHRKETALNEPLSTSNVPYIDLVVQNLSRVPADGEFSFDLYFDGQKVNSFNFSGRVPAGSFMRAPDWAGLPDLLEIAEGPHTLELVIDPDDLLKESDESDNKFETTFTWSTGQLRPQQFLKYSKNELEQMVADLDSLLDLRELVLGRNSAGYSEEVLDVVDAGYYLMTGKSIKDERVNIFLLTHDDYLSWIDDRFLEVSAITKQSSQETLVQIHERFKDSKAFKTRRFGNIAIVVDAEREPVNVINSIVHEVGHMRQDLLNPAQTEANGSHSLQGVQEAQAQQFERAFWLTLEGFTGTSLLAYPDYDAFRGFIEGRYSFWVEDLNADEHSLGYLLQWLAVLDDPALDDLRGELQDRGELTSTSSLKLYDHLVNLEPSEAREYVEKRLSSLEGNLGLMKELSINRLSPGLHPNNEGAAILKTAGLLAP